MAHSEGTQLKISYTGTTGGDQFDERTDEDPLEVTLGQQKLLPGLEAALSDMDEGETRHVEIDAQGGYGERTEDLVQRVSKEKLSSDVEDVSAGARLQLRTAEGRPIPVVVQSVGQDEITIDANHPLAGKDLEFDVKVLEVIEAEEDEE